MRVAIPSTAIGLALAAAAATVAHAQTIITPDPVVTVPAATVVGPTTEIVQTTETVRTIQPIRPHLRRSRDDAHHNAPGRAGADHCGAYGSRHAAAAL